MSVEEKVNAGYQVAPNYEELKERAEQVFEHIPQRESKKKINKQFIFDELDEDASQGSFKQKEMAKDKIAQDQDQEPAKDGEVYDYELIQETNEFGFIFTKQKDGEGLEVIKSQS